MYSQRDDGRPVRRRFPIRWLVVVLCLSACYSWRPTPITPAHEFGRGDQVRIAQANGRRIVLLEPRMAADTVVGHTDGSMRRVAVPLADVRSTETLHFSARRTGIALLATVAIFLGVGAIAMSEGSSF